MQYNSNGNYTLWCSSCKLITGSTNLTEEERTEKKRSGRVSGKLTAWARTAPTAFNIASTSLRRRRGCHMKGEGEEGCEEARSSMRVSRPDADGSLKITLWRFPSQRVPLRRTAPLKGEKRSICVTCTYIEPHDSAPKIPDTRARRF